MNKKEILALLFAVGLLLVSCSKSDPFIERNLAMLPDDSSKDVLSQVLLKMTVEFSPDGSKVAYIKERKQVVVNGKEQPQFEEVNTVVFSPFGKLAYAAKQNGKWFVVLDGEKGEDFSEVKNLVFSSDGNKLVYVAKQEDKQFVIVNSKKHAEYKIVGKPKFNFDGSKIAYIAADADKIFIVSNEQKIKEIDATFLSSPEIKDTEIFFVQDEVKVVAFVDRTGTVRITGGTGGLTMSPSSGYSSPAYLKIDGKNTPTVGSLRWMPEFSKDFKSMAYVSTNASVGDFTGKNFIVVDGKAGTEYDFVKEPTFNDDGSKFAFIATESKKSFVVVGDKKSLEYDEVFGPIVFSSKGDKIAFGTRQGQELSWKVMVLE